MDQYDYIIHLEAELASARHKILLLKARCAVLGDAGVDDIMELRDRVSSSEPASQGSSDHGLECLHATPVREHTPFTDHFDRSDHSVATSIRMESHNEVTSLHKRATSALPLPTRSCIIPSRRPLPRIPYRQGIIAPSSDLYDHSVKSNFLRKSIHPANLRSRPVAAPRISMPPLGRLPMRHRSIDESYTVRAWLAAIESRKSSTTLTDRTDHYAYYEGPSHPQKN